MTESLVCIECREKALNETDVRKRMFNRMIEIAGSEGMAKRFNLRNFTVFNGLEEVFRLCENFAYKKHNLYLWGKTGRGKTHLAYSLAFEGMRKALKVEVTSFMRLVDFFRAADFIGKQSKFRQFTECDILVIDDMGISKSTDFALEIVSEIFNQRSMKEKNGIIVTSNLDLDDLCRKNQDDRIASRIAGMCKIVECVSEYDYRLESASEV